MSATPPEERNGLAKLPPGRATQDYARDSLAPFEPLKTVSAPAPAPAPAKSNIPWVALIAVTAITTISVIGIGLALLG